jgi:2-polyprenyl-6-methoxyphenol hydroxylase-like FAD-dependent oxidoreductase
VGGLCTALALRQAGIEAHVYEQAPELREVGAGLHIWTNAVRVLQGLGLADTLEGHASVMNVAEFRTASGSLLASWPQLEIGRENGAPTLQISREELSKVLSEAVGDVHLDRQVTGFDEDEEHVTVRFADGASDDADALVRADGLHSGCAPRSSVTSLRARPATVWRGVSPAPASIGRALLLAVGRGRAVYLASFDVLYWMSVSGSEARTPAAARPSSSTSRAAQGLDEADRGADRRATRTRSTAVIYDRARALGQGRVTLLGDAAHAMTFDIGQGAGQSIEDALVLSRLVSQSDDLVAALRAYEQRRQPRTKHMQGLSRKVGQWGRWDSRGRMLLRSTLARLLFGNPIAFKQFQKDLTYEF